jgi:triosephosphate isomerase
MRAPVFAANWKMNHAPREARRFMHSFTARWSPRDDRTVIICPSAIAMTHVVHSLADRPDIVVGAQNIWTEDKGAFTGETSAPMVKDAGARYVLVGHSERRHVFGETDEETAKKCAAAARNDLTPILCVGELLSQREANTTNEIVLRQLRTGLSEISRDVVASMAIAYEPVWAIGTGKTATPNDASAVHAVLRAELETIVGGDAASIPILYGGSVNAGNARSLLAAPGVNGLLVGGASLEVESWISICEA